MPKKIDERKVKLQRLQSRFHGFDDGQFYEWREGIDFHCTLKSLKVMAGKYAREHELYSEFGTSPEGHFCLRFVGRNQDGKKKK